MLVHYRKQFCTCHHLFSTLIGLQPTVRGIEAVGTDGEKALVEAWSQNFPHASQVRCFRHLQQNVEQHLRENQFPSGVVKEYIQDIFGWCDSEGIVHEGIVHEGIVHEGLVDCCSADDFNSKLHLIKEKWDYSE